MDILMRGTLWVCLFPAMHVGLIMFSQWRKKHNQLDKVPLVYADEQMIDARQLCCETKSISKTEDGCSQNLHNIRCKIFHSNSRKYPVKSHYYKFSIYSFETIFLFKVTLTLTFDLNRSHLETGIYNLIPLLGVFSNIIIGKN